jgi:hypothetical protein
MEIGVIVSTTIAAVLALLGYLITHQSSIRIAQRKERLERVNRQLSEFYGPLFALTSSSRLAWGAFQMKYSRDGSFFDDEAKIPADELEAWRLWMTTVFMPSNLRIYELIVLKTDLLIETEIPDCLLKFCAHVSVYQTILKRWEKKDFSEHLSVINFHGGELLQYSENAFRILKDEQDRLIRYKRVYNSS